MPQEWDLNRRVVIGNLPGNASKREIILLFGEYGTINNIFVAHNPPGFAFLEYEHRSHAELAVRKGNGQRCCASYVSAELTIRDLDKTVVVRNLSQTVKKEEIRNVFRKYGRIRHVWIHSFQQDHLFGLVEYNHSFEATAAVRALNGICCFGRIIHVSLPRHPNARTNQLRQQQRRIRYSTITSNSSEASHSSRNESKSRLQSNRIVRSLGELTSDSRTNQRLDCSICMNNTLKNRPTSTTCGHIFCEICIKSALQRYAKCPNCGKKLIEKDLIRMYPSF